MLRHPSFQGLREDKSAKEIVREEAGTKSQKPHKANGRPKKSEAASDGEHGSSQVAGITLSNPGRVVYPEQGLTKLDLARFYESIADWVLPHIIDRPLTLVRCPRTGEAPVLLSKHLPDSMPDTLRGVEIDEKGSSGTYVVIDDLPGLISLIQVGVLEMHPWGARADDVERPDRLVFDLDPGEGVAWAAVIEARRLVRDELESLGLQSFVHSTGGKGLHVVAPLTRRTTWDDAQGFCPLLRRFPGAVRPGPLYRDDEQGEASRESLHRLSPQPARHTAVASYSTRARAGAPVATPLTWDELSPKVTADQFTVATLPRPPRQAQTRSLEGLLRSPKPHRKNFGVHRTMTFTPSCPSCLGGFSWLGDGNEASICSRASKPTGFTRW